LDEAINQAAQAAIEDSGINDYLMNFSVEQIHGKYGGLANLHEIEMVIAIQEEKASTKCKEAL